MKWYSVDLLSVAVSTGVDLELPLLDLKISGSSPELSASYDSKAHVVVSDVIALYHYDVDDSEADVTAYCCDGLRAVAEAKSGSF